MYALEIVNNLHVCMQTTKILFVLMYSRYANPYLNILIYCVSTFILTFSIYLKRIYFIRAQKESRYISGVFSNFFKGGGVQKYYLYSE